MIKLQDFTSDEISELQRYIEVHSHHTVLQTIYSLSENPIDKALIFINVFRIIDSCKNYTKDKLNAKLVGLIGESQEVYNEIYPIITSHESLTIPFGKSRLKNEIVKILSNPDKHAIIRKLIDAFLVFGEKIELNDINNYLGLDLENDYGKKANKELREVIDAEKI